MKKIIILSILIPILSYTGYHTFHTQIAHIKLRQFQESIVQDKKMNQHRNGLYCSGKLLALYPNMRSCKVEDECFGICFQYRNLIDEMFTDYGNEILFIISLLGTIILVSRKSKKDTIVN